MSFAFSFFLRGSMTKQMKAAMAAMLMVGTLPMQAQEPLSTTTKTVKVKPGETKTTVITKEQGTSTDGAKKRTTRRRSTVHHEPVESELSREIRELKEKQAAQQAEIDALTQANAAANAALASAQSATQAAQTQAQAATQQAQSVSATVQANTDAVQALKSNVSDLQTTNAGLASTISANKVELTDKIESPTTIHYKGITIKPTFILMAEGVWRQRAVNSGIATPFNSIPFMGANDAHTTETNFSARQTRLGGLFTGDFGPVKASGYFESDFLGAGTTSNNNQTDSYLFRIRQAWGKVENKSGTTITGGQMYSLVTEDGKSTNTGTEKLPTSIDPNYVVGWTWARQPGFRVQQQMGNAFMGAAVTVAASVEEAQIQSYTATNAPTNFFFAGPGQTGGLYNSTGNGASAQNYTTNLAPDVITKVAIDAPMFHAELGGVARFFRERVYPGVTVPATGYVSEALAPYNDLFLGGGVFANVRVSPKVGEFAIQGMAGDGTGRYASSQLADVTVHPDGELEPVRNYHGIAEAFIHVNPKFDLIANYGGEYAQRTVYATGVAATPFTGYSPINANDTGCNTETNVTTAATGASITPSGTCAGATRYIQEGMLGFQFKPFVSPKYGQILYRVTYDYLERQLWTGVTSGTFGSATATYGAPKAIDNLIHFSMRYYIP
jgi:hypothetical protein